MCDVCSEWCQASPGGEDSRCLPGPGSGSWLGYREGSSDHWPHPFHHQPPAQTLTTRNTQHIRHQLQCKTNYTVKHTVKSLMNTPCRHCLQCSMQWWPRLMMRPMHQLSKCCCDWPSWLDDGCKAQPHKTGFST